VSTRASDPILLEVVRNQLDGIAEEMEVALVRSAYSSIVKEGHDASTGLFDAQGEMIAQSTALPAQLGLMSPAVATIIARYPPHGMGDGDVFILNDPYDGGSHIPDVSVVAPVVHEGEVVAFVASIAHHMDMGGMAPGSMPANATEVYQEGLRLPPLRLYEAGRPNEALHAILGRNVRIPETTLGDLRAQLAATHVGVSRLRALFERHGRATLRGYTDELLDRAEAITRSRIAEIPDGTYAFEDYLDNDGIELDRLIPIRVTVTVSGSDLHVDFAGSSPQVRGPLNSDRSAALSAVHFVVRALAGGDAPKNGGVFRPLTVELPLGTVVNPRPPAPVNARTMTMKRIADTLLGALVQAIPERIPAAPCGLERIFIFGGVHPGGRRFVCAELDTGGSGGSARADGIDVIRTDIANVMNVPAEALELNYPLRVHRNALRPDSAGAGRRRGGLGHVNETEVLRGPVHLTVFEERHRTRPWGLFGGKPGAHSRAEVRRADGRVEAIPTNSIYVLETGDRVVCDGSAGGGGYGDPYEREPELVLADVLDRKLSVDTARADYGVVIQGSVLDEKATAALRAEVGVGREPITWTYDRGELGRS